MFSEDEGECVPIAVGPVTQKELLTKDLWICCVLSVCVCVRVCVCACVRVCVCVRWLCSRYIAIYTHTVVFGCARLYKL